jgi:ABC-type multidrug transport system fused ATPase/permease subunit
VSIARALAGEPQLLIMDEPTSALDVRSESLIRQTLSELRGQVTVIIIAHRLSTLDICDRIMVIQGGRLRAMDSAASLARDNAFYRQSLELSGMRA